MSAPYICKKCGKEMWSLADVVDTGMTFIVRGVIQVSDK